MKQLNLLLCLAGIIAVLISGCDKDNNDPNFPVDFELQLLNSEGIESTSFSEGESVTFRLALTNTTEERVNLTNFVPDLICQPENDFFRVYQQSPLQKDWGRVCMPISCKEEGQFPIEANQTRVIEYTWSGNSVDCQTDMSPLPKGTYRTGFEYVFEANGRYNGLTSTQRLSTTFSVE